MSPAGGRAAGILLHPTSLPGRFGIGDLGPSVDRFLGWAAAAGQHVWQVLPLGATGPYNSPYVSLSTFAGNPLLISPERLVEEGLLPASAVEHAPAFPSARVDFARAIEWKGRVLRESWDHFQKRGTRRDRDEFEMFRCGAEQADWLEDWALFLALRTRGGGRPWTSWERGLHRRDPEALRRARAMVAWDSTFHEYVQFLFFRQWRHVKGAAARLGIRILGDLPIYVAHDSADVWANQRIFQLDEEGLPTVVAGVPPDYYSRTGQLWGNPLYRWDRLEEEGFAWWIARIRANLKPCDLLRIDHFRGFAAYWEVPASAPTAASGRWVPGPGLSLFSAVRSALGELPLVAEDLGHITPDVHELRARLGIPGMRVLQFAFDGQSDNPHLPGNHEPDTVVYTGTHDNDTTRGWFESLEEPTRRRVVEVVGTAEGSIEWDMIRAAYRSPALLAVVPMQDVLGLGSRARMNRPGVARGNWCWRTRADAFREETAERLARLAEETGRLAVP